MTSESDYNIYTSDTGGSKQRKLEQLSAIDPISRHRLAQAAGYGAEKYSRDNYMNGFNYSWCIDALHRHILAFEAGEYLDEESQLPHLAHAAWHCMALMTFVERELGVDDRFDTIKLPKGQEIARQNKDSSQPATKVNSEVSDQDRLEDLRSEPGEPLATDGSRAVTLDVDLGIEAILNEANEVRNKLQDSKPEEEFDFSEWTAEKHQVEHEDWLVASNDEYYSQLAWLESKNKEYAMGALDLASFKYILDERIAWIDELAQENSTMQRGLDLLENRLEEINRDIQREIDKLQEAQTKMGHNK